MDPIKLKRLLDLMSKAADQLSAEETKELATLRAEAESATKSSDMSAADVKQIVTDAVRAAGNTGLDEAKVKTIVAEALKALPAGVDQKALTDAVTASIPKGVTADDVKAIVEAAFKNVRPESKMVHGETESIELPIAHRAGNLSVAYKQLLNVMTKGADFVNADIPESILKDAETRGRSYEKRIETMGRKAFSTGSSGNGSEFMNTGISTLLLQRMYMESRVATSFMGSEIQMPMNPFPFPLSTTRPTFGLTAENAEAGEGTGGSGQLILNATKLTAKSEYSYEAEEDAVIAVLPLIIQQLGEAAAFSIENAIINGDTAGAQDTGTAANADVKAFNGIRKLAIAQAGCQLSLATGGANAANIGALRKLLKRWGLKPSDLMLIVGTNTYNDLILLPETLTAEKVGNAAAARILTGMAPSLFGIEIVPSAAAREDLNALGVYDNVTTTKNGIYLVYRPGFTMGVRRGFTLEQDKSTTAQKKWVVASFRRAFAPIESLASVPSAAFGFNF